MKLNEAQIEDLTGKVFRTIVSNGKGGILQSELWKELDLTSRDGSRVAIRLERRALIRREKMLENGRWTYKLFATKLPIDTSSVENAPCLTCPVEHMCSLDGSYSPITCNLIEDWLVLSLNMANQQRRQQEQHQNHHQAPASETEEEDPAK
ncbi:helix-turn-helix transcriptional regulator [Nitrososphaera viennensis]|mgnify:CR=1 FL=1|uniref:Transcriptional regulator n=2 Tax=Nitrososphaera viennensis TaxID=1034015 RepID=A0A977IBK0_9ARCH|nr:transcriptional regulator [Nitrososphaera viennensis]AIC15973.1 putative RNA polymerase subunit, Rpc34-like [Nitrososphaera viennensis EN76]UVS67949.1 transcriptional regulator [Nitrososphaera viennensis]